MGIAWDMDYAATMVVRMCALMDLLHQDPRHQGHLKLTSLRHQGRQSLRQQSLHQLPGLRQHPRPIESALLLSCPSVALLMLSLIVGHQALRTSIAWDMGYAATTAVQTCALIGQKKTVEH